MKNIAILGGSFNPITSSHMQISEYVINECSFIDEVYLMPCYQHTFGKEKAYRHDRLKLINMALEDKEKIKNFTYEIDNSIKGGTYKTLQHIKLNPFFNDCNFYLIIGSDCCFSFEKWVNYKKLAEEYTFIIVPRKDYELKNYKGVLSNKPHIVLKNITESETSSTEIRKRLEKKQSISGLVPEKVEKYLLKTLDKNL